MTPKLKQCCNKCKQSGPGKFCIWCIAQSVAFPVEHFVWTRLPGFSAITAALGLA